MSKETFYIRVQGYLSNGQPEPWEDIPATRIDCTETQISMYANLRSQETGCKVRVNKAGSHQGRYYGEQLARETSRVMKAMFGSTPKPDNDDNA